MATTNLVQENPYVTIENEEIDIRYRKNNYHLALDKVSKMYLSPKRSYWSSIPGLSRFMDKSYNLCIRTRDEQEINIDVKAFERQYFIDPIALVRKMKKQIA
jgi:hypothetical protein